MTDLWSPPKVCRVTSPGLKGKPLGSPVRTQTCQPSGSMTLPGSTVVVSSATEEKGMPQTMQIEHPPPPLPSGGTTASSQASTPSTQPIQMMDPLASPSQSPPSPSRPSPSSLSPSSTMLARSTLEQSPTVQLSVSSRHGTPAEGPSAPVSPATTKRDTPVQTAPGSPARSVMRRWPGCLLWF